MRMLKCEVCGAEKSDCREMRMIQIRKYKNMLDTKPVLERNLDLCLDCIEKIFGDVKDELDSV